MTVDSRPKGAGFNPPTVSLGKVDFLDFASGSEVEVQISFFGFGLRLKQSQTSKVNFATPNFKPKLTKPMSEKPKQTFRLS